MIDTHAHMLFFEDKEEIVHSMKEDSLEAIVNIGTTVKDSKEGVLFAERHKDVFATVGIYPEYAEETTEADLEEIKKLTKHEKVVAVGEIGLDYHGESFNKEAQKELFKVSSFSHGHIKDKFYIEKYEVH